MADEVWFPNEVAAEAEHANPPSPMRCRHCRHTVPAFRRDPDGLRFRIDPHQQLEQLRRHVGRAHRRAWPKLQAALDAPDKLRTTHEFYERPRKPHAPT